MDVELDPPQPDPVAETVAAALDEGRPAADPWWRAGIDDALGE